MLQLNKATSPSIKITVCPTPPLFNLFRDTVNAFNHTFSGKGGRRGKGGNLKLLEIRVLQNLVGSGGVARNLGMGGRERDIIQNWPIIFGIRQFMMLWFPGEQCVIALQELIFDNKSFCQLVMVRVKEKESKYQIFLLRQRYVFKQVDQVTADNTGIPIFLFGHSMVCTVIKTLLERCLFFDFCFVVVCLFVVHFLKVQMVGSRVP